MIWIILFGILFFRVFRKWIRQDRIVLGIMIILMSVLAGFLLASLVGAMLPTKIASTETFNLVLMPKTQVYLVKYTNGALDDNFTRTFGFDGQISREVSSVKEGAIETPYVLIKYYKFASKWYCLIGYNLFIELKHERIAFVPEGMILDICVKKK